MKHRKLELGCLLLAGVLAVFTLGVYVGIEKTHAGQEVTIETQRPALQESEQQTQEEPAPAQSEGQTLLDLNTAQLHELQTLPGIGPVIAQRILDYREQFGPFRTKEQIKDVQGIGDVRYEQIEALIAVEDEQ